MISNKNLKPCPFCGNTQLRFSHGYFGDYKIRVICDECGALSKGVSYLSTQYITDEKVEAWQKQVMEWWNRRC